MSIGPSYAAGGPRWLPRAVLVGPSGRKGELERSAKDLIRHRFSNPLGALTPAERYVAKYAAKEDTKVNRSLSAAEGYVAKYAAKEDTKMNRSLSGGEMLN